MTLPMLKATRLAADVFEAQRSASETATANTSQAEKILTDAQAAARQLEEETRATIAEDLRAAEASREKEIVTYVAREKERRLAKEVAAVGELAVSLQDDFDALGSKLVDLVTASVRKIIGDIDQTDAISEVVYKAMDGLRDKSGLEIRAGSAVIEDVRFAVVANADASEWVSAVVPDDQLNPRDIRIVHRGGLTDIGIDLQLGVLEVALQKANEAQKDEH